MATIVNGVLRKTTKEMELNGEYQKRLVLSLVIDSICLYGLVKPFFLPTTLIIVIIIKMENKIAFQLL